MFFNVVYVTSLTFSLWIQGKNGSPGSPGEPGPAGNPVSTAKEAHAASSYVKER